MPRYCEYCGRLHEHAADCPVNPGGRVKPVQRERIAKPSVAMAREWYECFGFRVDCISPTGRVLFGYLLEQVEKGQTS